MKITMVVPFFLKDTGNHDNFCRCWITLMPLKWGPNCLFVLLRSLCHNKTSHYQFPIWVTIKQRPPSPLRKVRRVGYCSLTQFDFGCMYTQRVIFMILRYFDSTYHLYENDLLGCDDLRAYTCGTWLEIRSLTHRSLITNCYLVNCRSHSVALIINGACPNLVSTVSIPNFQLDGAFSWSCLLRWLKDLGMYVQRVNPGVLFFKVPFS